MAKIRVVTLAVALKRRFQNFNFSKSGAVGTLAAELVCFCIQALLPNALKGVP